MPPLVGTLRSFLRAVRMLWALPMHTRDSHMLQNAATTRSMPLATAHLPQTLILSTQYFIQQLC